MDEAWIAAIIAWCAAMAGLAALILRTRKRRP